MMREQCRHPHNYPYYPGCTLYSKAKNLDRAARLVCQKLGVELQEMPSWNCCGAIYNTAADDLASQVGPLRNLAKASQQGEKLVTLCAACYNVLKRAHNRFLTATETERNRLLDFLDEPFGGEIKVAHLLEVLKQEVGWTRIEGLVKKPLNGVKVAAYYGCLMVRPRDVLNFDNPENPQVMDELTKAIGGTPVDFQFKTECCGGYLVVNRRQIAIQASGRVLDNARDSGAEIIVTTCPLCQYNLEIAALARQAGAAEEKMAILYFTQLLGIALGLEEKDLGFEDNKLNPVPFLKEKGLL